MDNFVREKDICPEGFSNINKDAVPISGFTSALKANGMSKIPIFERVALKPQPIPEVKVEEPKATVVKKAANDKKPNR